MNRLSPSPTLRQLEVLDALDVLHSARKYHATVRELGTVLGIKSTNGVNDHLKALARKGLLERDRQCARGLRITLLGHRFLEGYRAGRAAEAEAERVRAVSPECADEFTTTQPQENP